MNFNGPKKVSSSLRTRDVFAIHMCTQIPHATDKNYVQLAYMSEYPHEYTVDRLKLLFLLTRDMRTTRSQVPSTSMSLIDLDGNIDFWNMIVSE